VEGDSCFPVNDGVRSRRHFKTVRPLLVEGLSKACGFARTGVVRTSCFPPGVHYTSHAKKEYPMERRDFIAAIAAALTSPASGVFAQARTPSLKDASKNMFVIGTALDFRSPN